ncbi:hypothetical protein ACVGWC_04040, partial [Enterobacter hormaechei]
VVSCRMALRLSGLQNRRPGKRSATGHSGLSVFNLILLVSPEALIKSLENGLLKKKRKLQLI